MAQSGQTGEPLIADSQGEISGGDGGLDGAAPISDGVEGSEGVEEDEPLAENDPRRMSAEETSEILRDQMPNPDVDLAGTDLSASAGAVISALQAEFGLVEQVIANEETPAQRWEHVMFTTPDRNTVEVWWQFSVDALEIGRHLALEDDVVRLLDDGTEIVVRDQSPRFVQVVFLSTRVFGAVIVESGLPLPVDFVGSGRPEGSESLAPATASDVELLAATVYEVVTSLDSP